MTRPSAYLAGPIAGLTYTDCTDWRDYARICLAPDIDALSPMRGKEFLAKQGVMTCHGYDENPLSTSRGIMARDHFDAARADVVLVNFFGAKSVSIGTVMELAWAFDRHKPVVALIEPKGNPHDGHAMLDQVLSFRTPDLKQALKIVRHILLP